MLPRGAGEWCGNDKLILVQHLRCWSSYYRCKMAFRGQAASKRLGQDVSELNGGRRGGSIVGAGSHGVVQSTLLPFACCL